jgi:hypothetical protein
MPKQNQFNSPQPSGAPWRLLAQWGLVGLPVLAALGGCYTELEDQTEYQSLQINTEHPRTPNVPPASEAPTDDPTATPTTTAPTTSSTDEPPPMMGYTPSPGCEDVVGTIFAAETGCGPSGCHGVGAIGVVDLGSPEGIKERLLDKTSPFCGAAKYIDSENPAASLLLDKLKATPKCPSAMPPSGPLPQSEILCITEWVNAMANGDL